MILRSRILCYFLVALFAFGCGRAEKAETQKLLDEMLGEYEAMVVALETYNFAKFNSSIDRVIALHVKAKTFKTSNSVADEIFGTEQVKAKFQALADRNTKALKNAKANKKFSQDELFLIAAKFRELDRAL